MIKGCKRYFLYFLFYRSYPFIVLIVNFYADSISLILLDLETESFEAGREFGGSFVR